MDRHPPTKNTSPNRHPNTSGRKATRDDHVVLVLDDDPSILISLDRLLKVHGFQVRLHSNPEDFFRAGLPEVPACLLLDSQLGNGMDGVAVHAELQRLGWDLPTVFVTGHWNVQTVVRAIRAGADGFLTKPYNPKELVEAVEQALQRARARWNDGIRSTSQRDQAASLTAREREIVSLIVAGMLNKQIADHLDIALITVKVHRGRAMRKLGASNAADLVRIAALAGIARNPD